MAEAWGVRPWELEEDAPALWVDRWAAAENAKAQASEPKHNRAGSGGARRLI